MCKVGNWELYGIREYMLGGARLLDPIESALYLVATFSTEKKAKAYVKASLLKNQPCGLDKSFRAKSLLRSYTDYEIREKEESDRRPYDPEL